MTIPRPILKSGGISPAGPGPVTPPIPPSAPSDARAYESFMPKRYETHQLLNDFKRWMGDRDLIIAQREAEDHTLLPSGGDGLKECSNCGLKEAHATNDFICVYCRVIEQYRDQTHTDSGQSIYWMRHSKYDRNTRHHAVPYTIERTGDLEEFPHSWTIVIEAFLYDLEESGENPFIEDIDRPEWAENLEQVEAEIARLREIKETHE